MTFIIIVWGARGRWFESSHPDKIESIDNLMIVDAFCFSCILSNTMRLTLWLRRKVNQDFMNTAKLIESIIYLVSFFN